MLCCKNDHKSQFCPDCGKRLISSSSFVATLGCLQTGAFTLADRIAGLDCDARNDPKWLKRREQQFKRYRLALQNASADWRNWAGELQLLIDEADELGW
jgi:hypothetical protein